MVFPTTSWFVVYLVQTSGLSDSAIRDASSWASANGLRPRERAETEREFDHLLGQKQGYVSFAFESAPRYRTLDLYRFSAGPSGNHILGLDIDTYLLQGHRSRDANRRERARSYLERILSFIEQVITLAKPRYGIGDRAESFSTDNKGNSLPPSEEEVIDLLLGSRQKPWLAYLGAPILPRVDEMQIRGAVGWRTQEIAGGRLIVTRANPVELLA